MKFFNYIKKLIQSDSKESSKRFMALYALIVLITYVVVRYTNLGNAVYMVGTLCSFILTLAGVAAWTYNKKLKSNGEETTEQ